MAKLHYIDDNGTIKLAYSKGKLVTDLAGDTVRLQVGNFCLILPCGPVNVQVNGGLDNTNMGANNERCLECTDSQAYEAEHAGGRNWGSTEYTETIDTTGCFGADQDELKVAVETGLTIENTATGQELKWVASQTRSRNVATFTRHTFLAYKTVATWTTGSSTVCYDLSGGIGSIICDEDKSDGSPNGCNYDNSDGSTLPWSNITVTDA